MSYKLQIKLAEVMLIDAFLRLSIDMWNELKT